MEKKDEETISLKKIFVKYLRHWKLFLVVFVLSFIPAVLYLSFYPRTYAFLTGIQIQEDTESGIAGLGLGEAAGLMKSFGLGATSGSISIDDEISILKSNRMLRNVTQKLGLNITYRKPCSFYHLYKDTPLKLSADSATMQRLDDEYSFDVSVSKDKIKVTAKSYPAGEKEKLAYTTLPAKIKMKDAEFTLDFNDKVVAEKPFRLKIKCVPAGWFAEDLREEIQIEDISTTSNVLEISCTEHSKERGIDILNVLINEYNKDVASYKRTENGKTMQFVDSRIAEITGDLAQVELGLQKYKAKNDMTLLETDVLFYSENMKTLQTAIIEAEAELRIIDMLDEYVRDPENKNNVIPPLMSAAGGEKGGMVAQYNEAIVERDKLLKNSNETNPMFKIVDNQVNKLREGVLVMVKNARVSSGTILKDLKSKEQQLLSKMKTVPEKEREYVNYRRNQEILQGIYLILLQKREEVVLSLGTDTDRARVIEPAFAGKKPLGPRKLFAAIGMIVMTLVVPIGYLFAKDLFLALREEYQRTQ